PRPARDEAPDASDFLSDVLAVLLEKEPDRRFASASELARVLEEGERSAWWAEREARRGVEETGRPRILVRRETALTGRAAELALLREAWASARAGRGRAVLVEGEAGIGKTRLVDAFLGELAGEGAHLLYGSYPPSGG